VKRSLSTQSAKASTRAALPGALQQALERWRRLPRAEQDVLYAREIGEPLCRYFAELPLQGAPTDLARPRGLVSVLGLSWQPVALMAAWCKPERMLVIGTEEALKKKVPEPDGETVLSIVARMAGISRDMIETRCVADPDEEEIYRAVREFLRRSGMPAREIFVDLTGGKKSMSASAALAAFLVGAPLVYVDYHEYHGSNRIPVAGTEYPRLLANPLDVFGDVEFDAVTAAFDRGDFSEAERLAKRLAERLYEPREAECLADMARGYCAWDGFNFTQAYEALSAAREKLHRFSGRGRWAWAQAVEDRIAENLLMLEALKALTERVSRLEDGIPLLACYIAAATRLLAAGKLSQALLLAYAAMERYVNLCLWVDFGLDDKKPEYGRIEDRLAQPEVRRKYDHAGRRLVGDDYQPRDPQGPLMFVNGSQLLAALAPERLSIGDLGPLKGLSHDRNRCEFEHGFLPQMPDPEKVKKYIEEVRRIIAKGCVVGDFETAINRSAFPRLSDRKNL
jgi:CRISPR-associated protein (TIGR02710 family)